MYYTEYYIGLHCSGNSLLVSYLRSGHETSSLHIIFFILLAGPDSPVKKDLSRGVELPGSHTEESQA